MSDLIEKLAEIYLQLYLDPDRMEILEELSGIWKR